MANYATQGVQSKPDGLISREAARDLSSYQYHAATIASDDQVDYCDSSAGTIPFGVLQNKPDAEGKEAEVASEGTSLMRVDGNSTNISIGDKLGSNSNYHGVKVASDKEMYFCLAMEESDADDDLIEVKLLGGPQYIGA